LQSAAAILDIFPVASATVRIEFFGDEIEQIRIFDPVGQKSMGQAKELSFARPKKCLFCKSGAPINISEYLGEDPFLFWDDLLAIEDTYVSLKNMRRKIDVLLHSRRFIEALENISRSSALKQY